MEHGAKEALPTITVQGIKYEWNAKGGLFLVHGMPSLGLWIESTLAGLMQGMQRMVGTERFNLCMLNAGRESIDGDWAVIASQPTFEDGFVALSNAAVNGGWGVWSLVSLDREERRAVFRAWNNWEALYQNKLGVDWGTTFTAGKFAGICSRLFEVNCWATQTHFQAKGDAHDEFVVEVSDRSVEADLEHLLVTDKATRADLAVALERLEQENAHRRRAEQEAQERLAMIETLSAPILQVWDGVLALSVLGVLSPERSADIMERLLNEIQRTQAHFAILDLTGVEVVDSFIADHLLKVARAVSMLGAQCIITGIQPAVAQTMANIQANFELIVTRATLRDGIKYCMDPTAPSN